MGEDPPRDSPQLRAVREADPERLREITARFAREYEGLAWQTLGATRWLGHSIVKPPQDIVSLQEIVAETRPDLIIETGVYGGGSTLFFATLFDLLGIDGQVIGVDLNVSTLAPQIIDHPRIRLIEGSSTAPPIVATLTEAARGRRVMVDLDSDHSASHVLAELRSLAPLVSPGCYLVVEDTWLGGNPIERDSDPGPLGAIRTWMDEDAPPFEVDRWRERLLLTNAPGGYLLRSGEGRPGPRREEFVSPGLDGAGEQRPRALPVSSAGEDGGLARLAAAERRLLAELEAERAGRRAEVAALRDELERQGAFVADRERLIARQRRQLERLRASGSGAVGARLARLLGRRGG